MLDQLVLIALSEVADKRATFSRGNIPAGVHRQLQSIRFTTADDRITVADTTHLALQYALTIGTPHLEPASRDRVFYTTRDIPDAETRLLEARPRHQRTYRRPRYTSD